MIQAFRIVEKTGVPTSCLDLCPCDMLYNTDPEEIKGGEMQGTTYRGVAESDEEASC